MVAPTAIEDQPRPALQTVSSQPENPFAKLVSDQEIAIVPTFTLESGVTLHNVPVAYTTHGRLSPKRDNALVICHAISGSADVADWWGPLMGGPGQAFDDTRFFIVCLNSLGSPYGSASPVTNKDGDASKGRYGPEFPPTTIRDDINIHRIVLDYLGVRQIASVVGGSMGGMLCLEWAFFGREYVRSIAPIATSAKHSAWGISWGEAQRQSIYSDPKYDDGYYSFDDPPAAGLRAARMSALLTYRTRDSFEARFGRNESDHPISQSKNGANGRPRTPSDEHWSVHNEGHKSTRGSRPSSLIGTPANDTKAAVVDMSPTDPSSTSTPAPMFTDPQFNGTKLFPVPVPVINRKTNRTTHHYFSAQSYLRYQGDKFIGRFDSNCYIALTRKLDTHDISRNRADSIQAALRLIEQPVLVVGIASDGLFTFAEQEELANGIPGGRLRNIDSPEGHDAFLLLLEQKQVNKFLLEFFREVLPDIMESPGIGNGQSSPGVVQDGIRELKKSSTFGEAEVEDLVAW